MYTNRDVFETIISEVTGKPKKDISDLMIDFARQFPSDKLDSQITASEYETLLAQLRPESAGILNWLIEGQKRVNAARNAIGATDRGENGLYGQIGQ